jgi:hypothetical protein
MRPDTAAAKPRFRVPGHVMTLIPGPPAPRYRCDLISDALSSVLQFMRDSQAEPIRLERRKLWNHLVRCPAENLFACQRNTARVDRHIRHDYTSGRGYAEVCS